MSLTKIFTSKVTSSSIRQDPSKCCRFDPFGERPQRICPVTKRLCRKDILYYEVNDNHKVEQVCIQ